MKRILTSLKNNKHATEGILFTSFGVFLLIYSLFNHYQMKTQWKLSPYLFPVLIAVIFIITSVSLFFKGKSEAPVSRDRIDKKGLKSVVIFTSLVFLYYILLPLVGFIITNIIMLSLFFVVLKLRSWWKVASLSVGITVVLYVVFQTLLHVRLPSGVF
ncbi:MAG: tripartite tricarboxylate transporter TctB family protein [Spirochaetia bacterium]|nr:tripartite tricarboxylate transporter TctB family protein [Spirochaetia bacterium]